MRDRPLILLLDDEDDFLEIASVKLRVDGFDTIITHSVPEALSKAEEILPDLILSDIYMPPGPNGWEFALAVRQDPKIRDIRMAFFSSLRDPKSELKTVWQNSLNADILNIPVFSKMDCVATLGHDIMSILK
jgi:CheY-like chemotaxis protein